MGYTHYWTPTKATPEQWDTLLDEAKQLLEALPANTDTAGGYCSDDPLEIKGGLGTGKPKFTKKQIWFNGDEERGLDHETFLIKPNKNEWNFCKTARKPYDLLVCAILIATYNVLEYDVSSDGGLEDWKPAINFYLDTIYGFENLNHDEKNKLIKDVIPPFLLEELIVT